MERFPELTAMPKNDASKTALVRAAVVVWEEIAEEVFEKLIDSMVRRLQAVIQAKGWYTKY